jgi:flotillin
MLEIISNPAFVVPAAIVVLVFALVAIVTVFARGYVKVAPNEVLAVSGAFIKEQPDGTSFKLVTGGGAYVIPVFQRADRLALNAFQIKLQVNNVPSLEGVRVTVFAVATVKIGVERELLSNAVQRFLHSSLEHIGAFAKEALEGSLRGVVARLTVEELVKDRAKFSAEVQEQVTVDLRKLGLVLDNFLIQDIGDSEGYIDALGKRRTAEVKRDAAIAEADAKRDEEIRVAEATRDAKIQSSEAMRAGEVAAAKAAEDISNALRRKEVIQAQNNAQMSAESAKVPIIASQAAAEEERKLRVLKVQAEQAEVEARIQLQDQERHLNEKRLEATVIIESQKRAEANLIAAEGEKKAMLVKADATREADIIKAGGERIAASERAQAAYVIAEKQAEAERLRMELEGRGLRERQLGESEGRKALAEAQQRELEASAAGLRAQRLAEAEGVRASLLAEAEGKKASKLAEAEGVRAILSAEADGVRARGLAEAEALVQKAEAFSRLGHTGQLLEIIDRAPHVIDALGKAGQQIVTPLAEAMGKGLANVGEVRIVDLGGGSANGGSTALERYATGIPRAMFQTLESARAMGFGPLIGELADKIGISKEALEELVGQARRRRRDNSETADAAQARPEPEAPQKDS